MGSSKARRTGSETTELPSLKVSQYGICHSRMMSAGPIQMTPMMDFTVASLVFLGCELKLIDRREIAELPWSG